MDRNPRIQIIFLPCCPLNNRRRAALSRSNIGQLFFYLFSCLSLAGILILLVFLISGNVYPTLTPAFSCSLSAGNVTWRGKSVQCCTYSKWVQLRCSLLYFFKFKALFSFQSWSCAPCRTSALPGGPTPTSTAFSFSGSSSLYTSTFLSGIYGPSPPMLRSRPTLVSKYSTLLPPT